MNSPTSPDHSPASARWKGIAKAVILALVVLPIVVIVARYTNYRTSTTSSIRELEAKIKERGEPLTLADLAATYPPVPDAENGAVLLLQEWKKSDPAFWQAFLDDAPRVPAIHEVTYARALPFLGSDARHIGRNEVLSVSNCVAATAYLEEQGQHLKIVEAVLQYSKFRFPIRITNGHSMLLPHLAALRTEARNSRIAALMDIEQGDVNAAIEAMTDESRVGGTHRTEPVFISQLVRLSCYAIVFDSMERLLSQRDLSAEQLQKLDDLVDQVQADGAERMSLIAERATDLAIFDLSPQEWEQMSSAGGESDEDGQIWYGIGLKAWKATGLRDADRQLILATMEKAISLADQDDFQALKSSEELFRNTALEANKFPMRLVSAITLPGLEKAATRFASFEAHRRAAKAAIAVERYRLAHDGHLPAKLDDLVPKFLTKVPIDPFDGQPMRYHVLTNGFVVYSVGSNGLDDGGKDRPLKGDSKDFDETFAVER